MGLSRGTGYSPRPSLGTGNENNNSNRNEDNYATLSKQRRVRKMSRIPSARDRRFTLTQGEDKPLLNYSWQINEGQCWALAAGEGVSVPLELAPPPEGKDCLALTGKINIQTCVTQTSVGNGVKGTPSANQNRDLYRCFVLIGPPPPQLTDTLELRHAENFPSSSCQMSKMALI